MTEFQQGEMNLIIAFLQKENNGSNARRNAMLCNSVERTIRWFCCPYKKDIEKHEIYTKAYVYERLKCFRDLQDYWYWIGHWEVDNDEDGEPVSWGNFLAKTLTTQEKVISFKILTNCTCCKRHQDLHGINKQNYSHNHRCSCTCRHMARWLKRCLDCDGVEPSYGFVTQKEVSCLRTHNKLSWNN